MRVLHKEWRNGRGGKWTARIRWYNLNDDGTSVRLKMETPDGERSVTVEAQEARRIWGEFKRAWT